MTDQTEPSSVKMVFGSPTRSLDEFSAFAQEAAALGATHVTISDLPWSRWQLEGMKDLYPSWSMLTPTIFKVVLPSELATYLPAEPADANLELIAARCAILRKLGLKAVFSGNEPSWLPESVFRDHPEWRGPHCELPVIASKPYFTPCIDHPEVLALYQRAVSQLCRQAPEIEVFTFATNDAGSGVCWSDRIYPGPNGPSACRDRSMGERVTGFLAAIQAGAREAGVEAEVHLTKFSEGEIARILPLLGPGQVCSNQTAPGAPWSTAVNTGWFPNNVHPVIGIPQPFRFLRELEQANESKAPLSFVDFAPEIRPFLFELYREFRNKPTQGWLSQVAFLERIAEEQYGQENVTDIVEAWHRIDAAVRSILSCRGAGYTSLLLVVTATQRWLTRPLVPRPLHLKPEEKDYYRKFHFTVDSEEKAANFHILLGIKEIHSWTRGLPLDDAKTEIRQALKCFGNVHAKLSDQELAKETELLAKRLQLLIHILHNTQNCIGYQDSLKYVDVDYLASEVPEPSAEGVGGESEQEFRSRLAAVLEHWQELRGVARDEIDNTLAIIRLLESVDSPVDLISMAATPEEEDVFTFGPDLVDQLRKRVEIMMDHWHEYQEIYPS